MTTELRTGTIVSGQGPRSRTLLEMMGLVAAAACGLALFRSIREAWSQISVGSGGNSGTLAMKALSESFKDALPLLVLATLALVALRLRRPRPALKKLARQPGILACGVASLFLCCVSAATLLASLIGGLIGGPAALALSFVSVFNLLAETLVEWCYLGGVAVFVAWIVLGVVQGWRAEPNWFDRCGRILGWGWVLLTPAVIAMRLSVALNLLF
jgi:hypothetical protein